MIKNIEAGVYDKNPTEALNQSFYQQLLGFAFERWCRENHSLIAECLGFRSVQYQSGAFFSRKSSKENPSFQADLIFKRADRVLTLCECKYMWSPVSASVIEEMERAIKLLDTPRGYTIEKVLITASGVSERVANAGYFDKVLTLEMFFK